MRQHILFQESDKGKATVELFDDRETGVEAFHKITAGRAALIPLDTSRAVRRVDFAVESRASDTSLYGMSDDKLRAEAKKRNLEVAANPLARPGDIIHAIQQDELLKNSKARDAAVREQQQKQVVAQAKATHPPANQEKTHVSHKK